MTFETKTRYGATILHQDTANAAEVVEDLIRELETEEFEEPDNEHTQIAISNNNLAVTVEVSGLLTLSDLRAITGSPDDRLLPELYIRATSREQVKTLLLWMAEGRLGEVRKAGWRPPQEVPPLKEELFRRRSTS